MKTYIVKSKENCNISIDLIMLGGNLYQLPALDNTYLFGSNATLEQILSIDGIESVREEDTAELVDTIRE